MPVLAIANQKGGSGKTTTSVNLAAALAEIGGPVLLVDCDPQANATFWSAIDYSDDDRPSMYDVLANRASVDDVALSTSFGYSVLPSSPKLADAEMALASVIGREHVLSEALPDDQEWIIVDCPPSPGILSLNALAASDYVLIPVPCDYLALEGARQLLTTIEVVRRRVNQRLTVLGIVPTFHTRRYRLANEALGMMRDLGAPVFDTTIRETVRIKEAPGSRSPLTHLPPSAGSEDYRDLAQEVIRRVRNRPS